GIVSNRKGKIAFEGTETIGMPSHKIARLGLAFCPEERGIFASLDVKENLMLPPQVAPGGLGVDTIFELFPNLRERLSSQGTKLSGGEQQMLTIGRALMTNPDLLLLDEATEGLAPLVARHIWRMVEEIRASGIATVIVDKNFAAVNSVTDRCVILVKGRVVFDGASAQLREAPEVAHAHLGV
ncbi:MAG: ABC transporter ATP-binding protein, partial [Betaproteobacteria bacterium]